MTIVNRNAMIISRKSDNYDSFFRFAHTPYDNFYQNLKNYRPIVSFRTVIVVRVTGLEPARGCHWNLNPARLPIPPYPRAE